MHEGAPLYVELPTSVEMTITYPSRACRATLDRRHQAATIETGVEIQVPLFIHDRRAGQGRHP